MGVGIDLLSGRGREVVEGGGVWAVVEVGGVWVVFRTVAPQPRGGEASKASPPTGLAHTEEGP